MFLNKLNPI